jgi:hypothetical protein
LSAFFVISANGQVGKAIYLRDGGSSDGSSFDQPIGDFKDAVRLLKNSGGTIVVCGEYSYSELILLSQISGTSNGRKVITVTSVYNGVDYRQTNGAKLVAGNQNGSANMILAGDFIFENIKIETAGSTNPRAIICNGNNVNFGEGIECIKTDGAPYLSIISGSVDGGDIAKNYTVSIKSGSYNNVCGSNKNGIHRGDSTLVIDGGFFEGSVSVTGIENENNIQEGNADLIINGGEFCGRTGLLSTAKGRFVFKINNGKFRNEIVCLAKNNVLEINGGELQRVGSIRIDNLYDKLEAETEKNDSQEGESIVNVNQYSGDVQNLVGKIKSEIAVINVNTQGGEDNVPEETEPNETDETQESEDEFDNSQSDDGDHTADEDKNGAQERKFFLGTRRNTVLVSIVLVAVIFSAAVLFSYRVVHRRK